MSKVIAIANQKGGVGKTTTTLNLAVELHNRGFRVLCVDFDHQANLSDYLGHEPDGDPTITHLMKAAVQNPSELPRLLPAAIRTAKEGVDYIPADINFSTAEMFLAQAIFRERTLFTVLSCPAMPKFDYILVDCLPSLGILLTNALIASNGLVIPVQAQKFALDGLDALMSVCDLVRTQANAELKVHGILLTMADNTKMSRYVDNELRKRFGPCVFDSVIRRSVEATNSSAMRCSLVNMSGSKLGDQYTSVVDELLERGV